MTTSGTTNFDLDNLDIIEDAYEIVGGEARGGYDLKTARRSLNLLTKEWGNRGLNLWTITSAQNEWPDNNITGAISLSTDVIDVIEVNWRTGSGNEINDRALTRMSTSEWSHVSEKLAYGTPTQYYLYRRVTPIFRIWPLPEEPGTVTYFYLRTIQDAGSYQNTMDVPGRFLPALVFGLAYYIAMKTPAATERVPMLQAEYERQFMLAAEEDRDRASFRMVPDLSAYNR